MWKPQADYALLGCSYIQIHVPYATEQQSVRRDTVPSLSSPLHGGWASFAVTRS
jgi:hypothetical protein